MPKSVIIIILIAGLIIPQLVNAQKIVLQKESSPLTEKKIHPVIKHFANHYPKRQQKLQQKRSENFNKLLVLLVEFQEDDNPLTTGNGKFVQNPEGYAISLGRPPHNVEFFETNLEALRYYYLAASFGQYDLSYDVYPKPLLNNAFRAYTLPQEMEYYNQINASTDLMISRFEEYFYDAMTLADADPEIDFSHYEHVMFIHAGSDWQHDVLGDTSKDMPSFFIQMGDNKEFVTSEGYIIDSACNVPETITQDIREIDGLIYGYGLINAVMAHEFGHSLGFVDLYNVNSFRPAVGYYDIMDSGGSGLSLFADEMDRYYLVEGGVPTLPSAWSRLLVPEWKEYFESMNYYKTVSDLDFDSKQSILPASLKSIFSLNTPYFVKVPLTESEYLLIENRQVDPDGDGGTSFVGALPETSNGYDYRVLLHPSYIGSNSNPNYEYDYFLPGWFSNEGATIGGGLVVWHIDDSIIYGNDNFANNTVNTIHSKRGVRVIEADNIQDIGDYYSYFWQGTAFEPFYKFMPKLNDQGYFTGWDDYSYSVPDGSNIFDGHYHNFELSATSKPALTTNSDIGAFYKIYDISSYPVNLNQQRIMTFKIGSAFFDKTDIIAELDSIQTISEVASSNFIDTDRPEFITLEENKIRFYNHLYSNQIDEWQTRDIAYSLSPTQPVTANDYDGNGSEEYFITVENHLFILRNDGTILEEKEYASDISEAPFYISEKGILVVSTLDKLFLNDLEFQIPRARCASDGNTLLAISDANAYLIDLEEVTIVESYDLKNPNPLFQPVAYYNESDEQFSAYFVVNANSEVIKISSQKMETIFRINDYNQDSASQLALHFSQELRQPYLVFGAGKHIFKIDIFGNLVSGFPMTLDNGIVEAYQHPKIMKHQNKVAHFITLDNSVIFAFDGTGKRLPEYTYISLFSSFPSHFYWDELSGRLDFVYAKKADEKTQVCVSYFSNPESTNPIIWNGFRNRKYGMASGNIEQLPVVSPLIAYAFPNPATGNYSRIKVKNAQNDIKLKIYDIAGQKLFERQYSKNPTPEQDLYWDISDISSGMYFGIIQSGSSEKKISLAIEK
jgi:M6 family metalloprotease-like protein